MRKRRIQERRKKNEEKGNVHNVRGDIDCILITVEMNNRN